jgi:hypothetical protein
VLGGLSSLLVLGVAMGFSERGLTAEQARDWDNSADGMRSRNPQSRDDVETGRAVPKPSGLWGGPAGYWGGAIVGYLVGLLVLGLGPLLSLVPAVLTGGVAAALMAVLRRS